LFKKAATIFAAFHISQSQKKGCPLRRFFMALIRAVFARQFVRTHNDCLCPYFVEFLVGFVSQDFLADCASNNPHDFKPWKSSGGHNLFLITSKYEKRRK
jgi:hypothetical protein